MNSSSADQERWRRSQAQAFLFIICSVSNGFLIKWKSVHGFQLRKYGIRGRRFQAIDGAELGSIAVQACQIISIFEVFKEITRT